MEERKKGPFFVKEEGERRINGANPNHINATSMERKEEVSKPKPGDGTGAKGRRTKRRTGGHPQPKVEDIHDDGGLENVFDEDLVPKDDGPIAGGAKEVDGKEPAPTMDAGTDACPDMKEDGGLKIELVEEI